MNEQQSRTTGGDGARRGVLMAFVGPSGVGKSSLCHRLMEEFARVSFSVSYTTRAPRGSEQEGVDYHYVDEATFLSMIEQGDFVEYARVHGNLYGTALSTVRQALSEGRDLLVDIDYQGAMQLKEVLPETVGIMVLPPSMECLESRLRGRKTDSEGVIVRRLEMAKTELAQLEKFDYAVINGEFEASYAEVRTIYKASLLRVKFYETFLRETLCVG